jgi:hypothetical protein
VKDQLTSEITEVDKHLDLFRTTATELVSQTKSECKESLGTLERDLRSDTEKQLHAICSMVEDLAIMSNKSENTLASKAPLIDTLQINLANLN